MEKEKEIGKASLAEIVEFAKNYYLDIYFYNDDTDFESISHPCNWDSLNLSSIDICDLDKYVFDISDVSEGCCQ